VNSLTPSGKTFLGLVLLTGFGEAVWAYFGVDHPIVQNRTGAWSAIILAAFFGFIAIKLARQTGFPDILDDRISNKERVLYPALLGFAFAIIEIRVSLAIHLPNIHVAFPLTIPVYLTGGIFLEILYHLGPVVFLVWPMIYY